MPSVRNEGSITNVFVKPNGQSQAMPQAMPWRENGDTCTKECPPRKTKKHPTKEFPLFYPIAFLYSVPDEQHKTVGTDARLQPGVQTLTLIGSNASALLYTYDGCYIVHRSAIGGGFVYI